MKRPSVTMLRGLFKGISICWRVTSTQDRHRAFSRNISESNAHDEGFERVEHGVRQTSTIENGSRSFPGKSKKLSKSVSSFRRSRPHDYTFPVTRERWSQIGITIQFLVIVRSLGEFFRLRHLHGANF